MAEAAGVVDQDSLGDLLLATGRGDRQAFARVYRLSASSLFAVALRTLRQRDLAEEVLQDAYLGIWKKARQFDPDRGQAMAWMITIVRHRAIDRLRSQNRAPQAAATLDDIAELESHSEDGRSTFGSAAGLALRYCLEKLKDKQQEAIRLAYYYGPTHEELADRLGTPLGTVKSWVRRGLLQLKECLDR